MFASAVVNDDRSRGCPPKRVRRQPPAVGRETGGVVLATRKGQRGSPSRSGREEERTSSERGSAGRRGRRACLRRRRRSDRTRGPRARRCSRTSRQRAPSPRGGRGRTEPRRPSLRGRRPGGRLRIGRSSRPRERSSAFRWPGRERRYSSPPCREVPPVPKREEDSWPPGRTWGKRCACSPARSRAASASRLPPASGTTSRDPLIFRVRTIRPSSPQLAPAGTADRRERNGGPARERDLPAARAREEADPLAVRGEERRRGLPRSPG